MVSQLPPVRCGFIQLWESKEQFNPSRRASAQKEYLQYVQGPNCCQEGYRSPASRCLLELSQHVPKPQWKIRQFRRGFFHMGFSQTRREPGYCLVSQDQKQRLLACGLLRASQPSIPFARWRWVRFASGRLILLQP